MLKIFKRKPKQIELSGNLNVSNSVHGNLPIVLHLTQDLQKGIERLLRKEREHVIDFSCKGPHAQYDEVTAVMKLTGDNPEIWCGRFYDEIYVLNDSGNKEKGGINYCYCGTEEQIPVVKKIELTKNKIFKCKYAESRRY